jgi:hypothetical protein
MSENETRCPDCGHWVPSSEYVTHRQLAHGRRR